MPWCRLRSLEWAFESGAWGPQSNRRSGDERGGVGEILGWGPAVAARRPGDPALPLQELSARIVEFMMVLFGSPVQRAGNVLSINGHDVGIAEACNGMRMVAALGLVAFAFVFTVPMRTSVRLLILALSPLVALL